MSTHAVSSAAPLVVGRHRSTAPAVKKASRTVAPAGDRAAQDHPGGGEGRPGASRGKRSWPRRLLGLALSGVLVVALLGFLLLAVGPHVFGYRTMTMLTGSMAPGINPGDVVVSVPVATSDIEVGDVITYHIPIEDHRVETHRVTEVIERPNGEIAVKTKGDANPNVDPWVATLDSDTVWEMRAVVPEVGTVIRSLRTPFVQDVVLWAALLGALALGLSTIWSNGGSRGERE